MISSKIIEEAVYNLCVQANTELPEDIFTNILHTYNTEKNIDAKQALSLILQNAQMAFKKKMPLCQDTGQVLVFVRGNSFPIGFNDTVQNAVKKAYEENFYRKSVVKNAIFNRENTKTNTPCIIYTELSNKKNDEIEIQLLLKGGGSENVCQTEMLSPTATENEIVDFVVSVVKKAGAKACPPYFIGIGIGGTMEYAGLLSKKALLLDKNIDDNHNTLAKRIKAEINNLSIGAVGFGGASTALDVKILTDFTHIACMPVAVTINCHSTRHAECIIETDKIHYKNIDKTYLMSEFQPITEDKFIKVNTDEIDKLKSLKIGQKVLLSGEIYTARDMAHKRLVEMIKNKEELPFDLNNKIIFYAGPCPSGKCVNDNSLSSTPKVCQERVVGSIGPTTSARMDRFAPILYENGILATIGKGERSKELEKTVKQVGGLYFTVIGGIACFLAERFIKKELVAFEDLGPEAIYRFEVEDLPLTVAFS